MSERVDMEVDDTEGVPKPEPKTVFIPRTEVKIISRPSVLLSLTSATQPRMIQTVPTTGTSGGKPQKLQIVRLVTPTHQHLIKTAGAPVRVVTTGPNAAARIQIAPSHSLGSVACQVQKLPTSQRLILPASSRPLASPQIVTIPVSGNASRLQTVLTSSGTSVFAPPSSGTPQQVLAILSPHKADPSISINQTVRVVAHSAPSSNMATARGYMKVPATAFDGRMETVTTTIKKEISADQRKPCNCTKSHCLKLYCDCFAKGEFCFNCNCVGCANILGKEEQRQKAIKQCLLRNPHAFHPKIGKGESAQVRRHQKGCNCKRSGCLKNYCECFEARIMCGTMCKCVGCKNCEENSTNVSLMRLADAAMVRTMNIGSVSGRPRTAGGRESMASNNKSTESMKAHLTSEVIEGALDCLLAQCREAEVARCKPDTTQKLILEEFGRCINRIIQSSSEHS